MESTGCASPETPKFLQLLAHPVRWSLMSALAASDLRVRELVAHVDRPQSLVSYHLGLLRRSGLVSTTRSTHDGRDTYNHLDLARCARALSATGAALHPWLGTAHPGEIAVDETRARSADGARLGRPRTPPAVLFVCTGNTARSPMAEMLLRHRSDGRAVHVASAGTRPGPTVHRLALRVLAEDFGLEPAGHEPRAVSTLAGHRFDHVITLCDRAREALPELAHDPRRIHWSVPDPSRGSERPDYDAFRAAAADIDTRIGHLLPVLGLGA